MFATAGTLNPEKDDEKFTDHRYVFCLVFYARNTTPVVPISWLLLLINCNEIIYSIIIYVAYLGKKFLQMPKLWSKIRKHSFQRHRRPKMSWLMPLSLL